MTHLEEIEGLLYQLEQQPNGQWIIRPPAGVMRTYSRLVLQMAQGES